jgi:hypothetical protein
MAVTDLETRARERLAQQQQAELERTMQALADEDAAREREQARQAAYATLQEEAARLERESQAEIDKLLANADTVLDAAVAAIHRRQVAASALASRAMELAEAPAYNPRGVQIGRVLIPSLAARGLLTQLQDEVLKRYYPRGTS